ncbi:OmpL47-type beta-barrel domain-containing protein [Pseudobacteriovorax antillogorgiicola]|uniref:Ig-like domain (Group 3) n=1 Tax=Pseudobacteriovorax antillogorgiicola TaxID=1513793 RepID=A0A1Y6BNN1_9BACT|nr:hypothetical protein [Pseudobacteriovorax antillogorgiicola]TCS54634.1 hypothetical protein EDD56_106147 [Pseudobacteriovorax antillogorgiicola]SMF17138.1 hypothetical protein SAMN06296036_10696 [Pseudobacteriovorax antillogorgiicola]
MKLLIANLCLLTPIVAEGSDKKEQFLRDTPGTYVDSSGQFFIHASMPLNFLIQAGTQEKQAHTLGHQKDPKNKEPIFLSEHGPHKFTLRDGKRIFTFPFYVDKKAPSIDISFSKANSMTHENRKIFGKGLSISLSASDRESGLHKIYYRLNQEAVQEYEKPIAVEKQGKYRLQYFARDRVGNTSDLGVKIFEVDTTPPKSVHKFVNAVKSDKQMVLSQLSKINIGSTDEESLVSRIDFQITDQKKKPVQQGVFRTPLNLKTLKMGAYTLSYYSIDQVQNREDKVTTNFFVDTLAPLHDLVFNQDHTQKGRTDYISQRTKIALKSSDNVSGVDRVEYALDGSARQPYQNPFSPPPKNGFFSIDVLGEDKVGNQASKTFKSLFVDRGRPTVSFLIQGPVYQNGSLYYVAPQSKLVLNGEDKESGLKKIEYTINNEDYVEYKSPLRFDDDGSFTVEFKGLDFVNNMSPNRKIDLFLDDKKPKIFHRFSSSPIGDREHQGKSLDVYPTNTSLFLGASDDHSGIDSITYSLNNKAAIVLKEAMIPLTEPGLYEFKVFAKDRVANMTSETIRIFITSPDIRAH